MNVFCTNIKEFEIECLEKYLPEVLNSGRFSTSPLLEGNVSALPKDSEILIVSHTCILTERVMRSLPKLTTIITRSTGFDHIDTTYCKEKNIVVENIPGYSTVSVAEYSVTLLLVLLRNIHLQIISKETRDLSLHSGTELQGKRVGIVGYGEIGKTIARIVVGFGAHVIVTNPTKKETGLVRATFTQNFYTVMKTCDIIFFCCPLTSETKHLVNKQNIYLLKRGVILVNTARGGILETPALEEGLHNNHLGGVAIDVLEEETEILNNKEHSLWKKFLSDPRVIFTPHNAFLSFESLKRMWTGVSELVSFAEVQELASTVS